MKKSFATILVVVIVISLVFVYSKDKAEQVALPIMEQCWNANNLKIVSLTSRLNFREGLNWLVKGNYTNEGFSTVIENQKYGDVPEVLVSIFTNEIVWKHFEEIGDASEGCGND